MTTEITRGMAPTPVVPELLVFEDPALARVDVWARPPVAAMTDDLLGIMRQAAYSGEEIADIDIAAIDQVAAMFAESLVFWNQRGPATLEGVHSLDPSLMISMVMGWLAFYEKQVLELLSARMLEQNHLPEM